MQDTESTTATTAYEGRHCDQSPLGVASATIRDFFAKTDPTQAVSTYVGKHRDEIRIWSDGTTTARSVAKAQGLNWNTICLYTEPYDEAAS